MKYAWIENNIIRDVTQHIDVDPSQLYHPDIAKFYDTEVPNEAQNGDGWVDGVLVPKPAPTPEPEPTPEPAPE